MVTRDVLKLHSASLNPGMHSRSVAISYVGKIPEDRGFRSSRLSQILPKSPDACPRFSGYRLSANFSYFFQVKLDTESLIGIMGNEHISFKSRTPAQCLNSQDPNLGTCD